MKKLPLSKNDAPLYFVLGIHNELFREEYIRDDVEAQNIMLQYVNLPKNEPPIDKSF